MSNVYQSLSHSKWDCKYHVVFIPKRRRKILFLKLAEKLGPVFRDLARQKECEILEGSTMSDHVHMCIAIPPKHSVASIIGVGLKPPRGGGVCGLGLFFWVGF
jgi:putative transposase